MRTRDVNTLVALLVFVAAACSPSSADPSAGTARGPVEPTINSDISANPAAEVTVAEGAAAEEPLDTGAAAQGALGALNRFLDTPQGDGFTLGSCPIADPDVAQAAGVDAFGVTDARRFAGPPRIGGVFNLSSLGLHLSCQPTSGRGNYRFNLVVRASQGDLEQLVPSIVGVDSVATLGAQEQFSGGTLLSFVAHNDEDYPASYSVWSDGAIDIMSIVRGPDATAEQNAELLKSLLPGIVEHLAGLIESPPTRQDADTPQEAHPFPSMSETGSANPSCGANLTDARLLVLCGAVGATVTDGGGSYAIYDDESAAIFDDGFLVDARINTTRYDDGPPLLDDAGDPIVVGAVNFDRNKVGFHLSTKLPNGDISVLDIVDFQEGSSGGIVDCLTPDGGIAFIYYGTAFAVIGGLFEPMESADLHDCSPSW